MGKKEINVNSIYTTTEYLSILHSLEKQTNLELDKKRIIGKGGYSQVYQAKSKGGKIFAAKIITIPKIEDKTNKKEIIKYEINKTIAQSDCFYATRAIHKAIIRAFQSYSLNKESYAIVMQKASASLNNIITQFCNGNVMPTAIMSKINLFNQMGEMLSKYFFNQIIPAMMYLKENNWVHFDIKPDNFLLCGNDLKLSDFGLCTNIKERSVNGKYHLSSIGTFSYLPPEYYNNGISIKEEDAEKVDVFGLGCVLFRMLYYKFVIEKVQNDPKQYTQNDIANKIANSILLSESSKRSQSAKRAVAQMIEPNINKRISMNEVFDLDWRFEGKKRIDEIAIINEDNYQKNIVELQKLDYTIKPKIKKCKYKFKSIVGK